MINKSLRAVLITAMVLAVVSFALARAAPTKQFAFTGHQAVVVMDVAPIVQSVPPMTVGYDVICNFTKVQTIPADTSATSRLSATVDWRSTQRRPTPETVLLA